MPRASPEAVARFEALVPAAPDVTRKLVFGQPAALVNGHLFFGVFGESVFVRLADSDQDEAVGPGGMTPFEPMRGRKMTGYYVLPTPPARDAAGWVQRSLTAARRLPAKDVPRAGRRAGARRPPRRSAVGPGDR